MEENCCLARGNCELRTTRSLLKLMDGCLFQFKACHLDLSRRETTDNFWLSGQGCLESLTRIVGLKG